MSMKRLKACVILVIYEYKSLENRSFDQFPCKYLDFINIEETRLSYLSISLTGTRGMVL